MPILPLQWTNMHLTTTPHNDFFAQVMRRKDIAKPFFQRFLPDDIRPVANLSQMTLVEGKHISDQGVTLYNDLLYKCPLAGKQMAYFFLMAEHQRNPYPHMPLRLMGYDLGAKEECAREGQQYLPIIVHFVLYNGTRPWPYSTAFTDYYADAELGAKYLYMAPFILIDMPTMLASEIQKDTSLGFCFAAFKATTTPDPYQSFADLMQMASFEQHIRGLPRDLKDLVARYLGHFVDKGRHSLAEVVQLVSTNPEEEQRIMTSIAQDYQQKGMQQGMQQERLGIAKNLLYQLHLGVEAVQRATGLSRQEIEKLA